MNLNDVKIGDRVRITYEGPVTDKNGYGIWIGGVNLTTYTYLHPTVEILEPAKPPIKFGDKLTDDVAARLPAGSAVVAQGGLTARKREDGTWLAEGGGNSFKSSTIVNVWLARVIHVEPVA